MTNEVNDILRVTAVLRTSDQVTINNVYHTRILTMGNGDDSVVADDVAAWLDFAYTEVIGLLPTGVSFIEVTTFNVTKDSPLPTASWPTLTAGTGGGDITPEGVAALIIFRTAVAHVIGRKFIGTLAEADTTNALLTAGALTDLAQFAAALLPSFNNPIEANTYRMGILGKTGALHAITSAIVAALPAYQRRRRRGRGI